MVALLALCAAMLIQIGTNLYNDVGDYERGADRPTSGPPSLCAADSPAPSPSLSVGLHSPAPPFPPPPPMRRGARHRGRYCTGRRFRVNGPSRTGCSVNP